MIAAGNVTLQAGQSILNATAAGQRQYANVTLSELSAQALAALGYARRWSLIAGQSVGQLGADLSATGRPCWSICRPAIVGRAGAGRNQPERLWPAWPAPGRRDGGGRQWPARRRADYALEDILNGTAPGRAALTARNAWLGTLSGGIGGAAQPLLTDLSGYLIALARGPWRSAS